MNASEEQPSLPEWVFTFHGFRKRLFLRTIEPIIERLVPLQDEDDQDLVDIKALPSSQDELFHRRLSFLPDYVQNSQAFKETSMSFATLIMLFLTMTCVFLIFLSCFYHNQKTSPLFTSPRRHRLPKLVPPPLPVQGYFSWIKVCFFMSDEEIIHRIGYDSLIFLRFHRLALRCIVKMSLFSFVVLLPLNFTGGGHANAQDLKEYVGSLFFTDFLRFTMANVVPGSPRLWVHCFAAYLLTGIVVRELLIEYETFNSIRHRYLLSREPHLRAVLVTNIPRHLRSAQKITSYFKHVYPDAVKAVFMCQNCTILENLIQQRNTVLHSIERELLLLCRREKKRLFVQNWYQRVSTHVEGAIAREESAPDRLTKLYTLLEDLNIKVENEQRRRRRVMRALDRMEAGEGANDIDYVLASPYVSTNDPEQLRVLGLPEDYQPPPSSGQGGIQSIQDANNMETNSGSSSSNSEKGSYNDNHLRSRSPIPKTSRPRTPEADGILRADVNDSRKNLGSVLKAKQAIRRYGRIRSGISVLGRKIWGGSDESTILSNDPTIEEHTNEVTDKAFVIMRTYTAATIAIQSMHSSKPGSMQVSTAPEPRDVLWHNIYLSKGAKRMRSYIGEFLVILIITVWVVPVALVSLLVSESALISMSPRLAQLDQASPLFSAAIALVQPVCIVGLQQLLPPIFILIGHAVGRTSFSEVQMSAFSHYFMFQVLNVFLVTTIAGSIFDTVALIVDTPESAFEMLGNSLPRMSSFFITFVTMKTFLSLGVELVRIVSLIQGAIRALFFPNATLRRKRSIIFGCRAIDDPGWFPFHKILAQDMLVVVISVVFAVVAPLVLFPCALFCLFSRIMWTHHHMFVYESVFESGGMFWPKIFRRFVFGLVIAQMTITGQFILKDARHEAYATMLLMLLTYFFLRSTRARYDPTSSILPLEIATVMDITLRQEEEARNSVQSPRVNDDPSGGKIGSEDPYRKAYLQPCLRAEPRARPEQPFQPAQLGNENDLFTKDSDSMATYHDATASVRLKNFDQENRALFDKWWEDQLKQAGDQNFLPILFGEQCGTLQLSTREPHDPPHLATPHALV